MSDGLGQPFLVDFGNRFDHGLVDILRDIEGLLIDLHKRIALRRFHAASNENRAVNARAGPVRACCIEVALRRRCFVTRKLGRFGTVGGGSFIIARLGQFALWQVDSGAICRLHGDNRIQPRWRCCKGERFGRCLRQCHRWRFS